eukprot:106755_1
MSASRSRPKNEREQGHHGMKGESFGVFSSNSKKFESFHKRLKLGLVPDSQKPGRKPKPMNKHNKSHHIFNYITFTEQLEYCQAYQEVCGGHYESADTKKPNGDIESNNYLIAARKLCRAQGTEDQLDLHWYPPEAMPRRKKRKELLKRLKRYKHDEFILLHVCAVGEGKQKSFHKAVSPQFDINNLKSKESIDKLKEWNEKLLKATNGKGKKQTNAQNKPKQNKGKKQSNAQKANKPQPKLLGKRTKTLRLSERLQKKEEKETSQKYAKEYVVLHVEEVKHISDTYRIRNGLSILIDN